MRAMFAAFVALVVISIGAHYGLNYTVGSTQDQHAGSAVRLD